MKSAQELIDSDLVSEHVNRLIVSRTKIEILLKGGSIGDGRIHIPWNLKSTATTLTAPDRQKAPNPMLVTAITTAHHWLKKLEAKEFNSIEALATAVKQQDRWVRKRLNLAFLAPSITERVLAGEHSSRLKLEDLHAVCPLPWREQDERLRFSLYLS